MVSFFPTLYKGETLYSGISRFHIRSGNISPKATIEDLFGSRTVSAVVELPSNIDNLINNMPLECKYISDELIFNHTMFLYYTAFLPPERVELILESMKGENGGDIYNRTGLMASAVVQNRYFKFCPECIKKDKENYGELYWHRMHQIPGMIICDKHKSLLVDSKVLIHSENKHEFISANIDNCVLDNTVLNITALNNKNIKVSSLTSDKLDKLYNIAHNTRLLLNNKYNNKQPLWFQEQYINSLIYMGYATINGQIRQEKLMGDFKNYYGDELLSLLQSDFDLNNESNWLSMITRKHRKTFHPLRHLLLIQFLRLDLDELFNCKYEEKPFGEGPWLCLNTGANHYLNPVINDLKISYDYKSKKTIGTFSCNCGFIYKRSGPDKEDSDKFKIGRIERFGSVWESKLRELVNKRLSLRAIARELKVDTNTVDKYAGALGLGKYWRKDKSLKEKVGGQEVKCVNTDNKVLIYRKEWLDLVANNLDKTKTEIRSFNKKLYAWLYRNDKTWLEGKFPTAYPKRNMASRVDWQTRDNNILNEIQRVVNDMLNTDEKPEQITISRIGKKIGKLSLLEKHIDKLPLTKEFVLNNIESVEKIQLRRITWAIKESDREGIELKSWRILRKAGIGDLNKDKYKEYILEIYGCC